MQLNNKFGECCHCPAFMNDSRLFTDYMPHKLSNEIMMKKLKLFNSNDYREFLQNNTNYILHRIYKLEQQNMCQSNDINKFYINGDHINNYFNNKLNNIIQ
jgi:hypothetical protein